MPIAIKIRITIQIHARSKIVGFFVEKKLEQPIIFKVDFFDNTIEAGRLRIRILGWVTDLEVLLSIICADGNWISETAKKIFK